MKEGLEENHTILGIHFTGNEGTVDGLGYLNEFTEGKHEDIGLC